MLKIVGTPVSQAYEFANLKHGNQKYGEFPYIYHLVQVCDMTLKMGLSEEFQIVAYLHDILEDTETYYSELCEKFGESVANCVAELTHNPKEDYTDYLKGLTLPARKVKICDILCNLQESILVGNERLIKKYQKALFYLATN